MRSLDVADSATEQAGPLVCYVECTTNALFINTATLVPLGILANIRRVMSVEDAYILRRRTSHLTRPSRFRACTHMKKLRDRWLNLG